MWAPPTAVVFAGEGRRTWPGSASSPLVVAEQWLNPGPVVVEEAKRYGTAVVAGGIGGIPEKLDPEWSVEVDPFNPDDFARGILWALDQDWAGRPRPSLLDHGAIRNQLMEVYERAC